MRMAEEFAKTSEAVRLKVGCLIIKNGNIISHGTNGQPPGWHTEVCEDKVPLVLKDYNLVDEDIYIGSGTNNFYKLVTSPTVRHAEVAALEKMWLSPETTDGAEIVITHSPCKACSIKIKTAGIAKVYYKTSYRSDQGLKYLLENGILVEQID